MSFKSAVVCTRFNMGSGSLLRQ